ncbi:hypothetical protein [Methylorubrum sp. SB2]|uniref:hypothetical protein n=1 Tax=Methylorubrum subtropicum TaxID=3138812 RepID=UPI00313ACBE6
MTPRELDAFRAGLRQATEHALITALRIELRDDAGEIRQRAAIEALRGLAEGLKAEARPEVPVASGLLDIMEAIASSLETSGTTTCPQCSGRLAWIKDDSNGHVHVRCEGAGCIAVMQ